MRYTSAYQNLFLSEDDEEGNELDESGNDKDEVDGEDLDNNEDINLEKLFEPSDIGNKYNKEIDTRIKKEDIPERL